FFLERPRHLPDLHSFPTRRSSDLRRRRQPPRGARDLRARVARAGAALRRARGGAPLVRDLLVQVQRLDPHLLRDRQLLPERVLLDRKSTRLNSSHEWISYAVFFLQ